MKVLKIALFIILIIGLLALKTIWQSGSFKTIENRFSGTISKVNGIPGAEDMTIDKETGTVFISSDDRWAASIMKMPVKGGIFSFNLNASYPQLLNLTGSFGQEDFHPHGISLVVTPDGKRILFVVNHRKSGNFIERFEYRKDSLVHLESFTDDLIISPNDVVGVGERQFYFTNDHNEERSKWRLLKDLLDIGTGNVAYFDGQKMVSTSVNGIKYANGINVSADGKQLFVAATTELAILVYDRDPNGTLTFADEIDTGTGVDNIELDESGNLWVGCHPQLLKFLSHAKDEKVISPSEVIKLVKDANGEYSQETIYMNDGSEISASSVGAVYKNTLLIGPVFQRHFLVAQLTQDSSDPGNQPK